jgi:hypothetical protein
MWGFPRKCGLPLAIGTILSGFTALGEKNMTIFDLFGLFRICVGIFEAIWKI